MGKFLQALTLIVEFNFFLSYELIADQFAIRHSTLNYTEGPVIGVARILLHPAFTIRSFNFDLAIITLKSRINLTSKSVSSIAITPIECAEGSTLRITGYGQTENGPTSEKLLRADMTQISNRYCSSKWGNEQPITESMLCAVSKTQSTCKVCMLHFVQKHLHCRLFLNQFRQTLDHQ